MKKLTQWLKHLSSKLKLLKRCLMNFKTMWNRRNFKFFKRQQADGKLFDKFFIELKKMA